MIGKIKIKILENVDKVSFSQLFTVNSRKMFKGKLNRFKIRFIRRLWKILLLVKF